MRLRSVAPRRRGARARCARLPPRVLRAATPRGRVRPRGADLPPSTGRAHPLVRGGRRRHAIGCVDGPAGQRLDVPQHGVCGRIAVVARLRHRARDDRLEGGRRRRADLAERLRRRVDDREEERVVVRREERALADDRLVHHDAARVDVDAAVEVALAARLLGRHVIGRAHHHAGAREVELLVAALELRHHLRDAEIEDLHDRRTADAPREEDVLRLDVAMDDALVVRGDEARRAPGS